MRTYMILVLVGAACLCVVVAGEAIRQADARLLAAQESRNDAGLVADATHRRIVALLDEARAELLRDKESVARLQAALDKSNAATANARSVRDTARADLKAADDRLEKAYKDIAEIEKQLVDVSRSRNDLEQQLAELRGPYRPAFARIELLEKQLRDAGITPLPNPPAPMLPEPLEPKIDGVVLGVSDKVNLVLISVGIKDKVEVGMKFTVYRGSTYVSKLVVDKVEDGWAACRELTDFRKEKIEQGDKVSTRVFD